MYVHMYVYVCTYIGMYIHTYAANFCCKKETCWPARIFCAHMYFLCAYVHTDRHVCTYIHYHMENENYGTKAVGSCVHLQLHTYIHAYKHTYIQTQSCICGHASVQTYVPYMYLLCTCIHTHTYIHTLHTYTLHKCIYTHTYKSVYRMVQEEL